MGKQRLCWQIYHRMRRINCCLIVLSYLVVSWFFCLHVSDAADDTLTVGQVVRDWEFLESSNKLFRLMFFSIGTSNSRYLGIQYKNFNDSYYNGDHIKVVWFANRVSPLTDSSGNVTLTHDGKLVLSGNDGTFITINAEQPAKSSDNTIATVLDTGNFVLRAGTRIVWQSFDHPSDIWLPGMKLGLFHTQQRFLTSWLSLKVPSTGAFTLGVDPNNTKELVIWRRGVVYWRSGMWNGYNFTYFPSMTSASSLFPGSLSFSYFSNGSQSYFTYIDNYDHSSCIEMGSSGVIRIFEMFTPEYWPLMDSSDCDADQVGERSKGCVDPEASTCEAGDNFYQKVGTMDGSYEYLSNSSMVISDCKDICIKNCSCTAYTSYDSLYGGGTGCIFYPGQTFDDHGYETIYVRSTVVTKGYPRKRPMWLTIGGPIASFFILIPVSLLCYLRWRNHKFVGNNRRIKDGTRQGKKLLMYELKKEATIVDIINNGKKDHELPLFTLSSIKIATDNFSDANKIGQGGFGPVYKGMLVNGQEIAVKRLSRSSEQGLEEFKNEVTLISRLQHRNLVRLLGCCAEEDERILIYEYLPNKSLHSFLFDVTRRALLDWKIRVCIIEGIALGLEYLHKHSRLRIIHRDLKTSNILLDSNLNPKISDFGTARIFGDNESRANTNRIVGTYGYMSPEYALDGLFSVKSDVFSFGVMMLEIISGKKNTGFYQPDRALNLLGYAWDLWEEGRGLEIMDDALVETCSTSEVMRYIQVGFLCVQESASNRPTISEVVYMLSNEMIAIPVPKQPAFSAVVSVNHANTIEVPKPFSVNDVTISEVEGR